MSQILKALDKVQENRNFPASAAGDLSKRAQTELWIYRGLAVFLVAVLFSVVLYRFVFKADSPSSIHVKSEPVLNSEEIPASDIVRVSHASAEQSSGHEISEIVKTAGTQASLPNPSVDLAKPFYTLQLISYKSPARAESEKEKLSALGIDAFVITRQRFYQVCAGKYANRSDAIKGLAEMQFSGMENQYPDAFAKLVSNG